MATAPRRMLRTGLFGRAAPAMCRAGGKFAVLVIVVHMVCARCCGARSSKRSAPAAARVPRVLSGLPAVRLGGAIGEGC